MQNLQYDNYWVGVNAKFTIWQLVVILWILYLHPPSIFKIYNMTMLCHWIRDICSSLDCFLCNYGQGNLSYFVYKSKVLALTMTIMKIVKKLNSLCFNMRENVQEARFCFLVLPQIKTLSSFIKWGRKG